MWRPRYLSAESLALIYADFRVKQERGPDGREITKVSTLAEAFDVILNKLDNVTNEKRTRYTFVYAIYYTVHKIVYVKLSINYSLVSPPHLPSADASVMNGLTINITLKNKILWTIR